MRALAVLRRGKCLSSEYVNVHVLKKLQWRCAEGHEWWATLNSIKNNRTWCATCVGNVRYTIEEMQRLAEARGGKFLSETCTRALDLHNWKCEVGHIFKMRPANIISRGQWCPRCSNLLSERLCREIFESMLGQPFPSSRPKWLLNERGNRMELDGYCSELGLAFEYQGAQHYERIKHFHNSTADLRRRQKDDERKKRLCQKQGITLIEVPYTVSLDEMPDFIKESCSSAGLRAPQDWTTEQLGLASAYSPKLLLEMQSIAKTLGGRCLSDRYVNVITPLEWECAQGHLWWARPTNIKNGRWCPECQQNKKLNIGQMHEIAQSRDGRCLSQAYINLSSPLGWQCSRGHKWSAPAPDVKHSKSWCPECRKRNRNKKP